MIVQPGWMVEDAALGKHRSSRNVELHPILPRDAVTWSPIKSAVVYLGCQIQRIVVTQRKWILQSLISRSYVSMICKKASHIHVSEHCHQRHVMRSTENRSTKYKARRGFLWVGLRSRPDIMSTVGTAASMLVNNPAEALGLTKRHAYRPLRTDHVHTDASYAYGLWRPPGQGLVPGVTVSMHHR